MRGGDAERHRPHDEDTRRPLVYRSAGLGPRAFPATSGVPFPGESVSFRPD